MKNLTFFVGDMNLTQLHEELMAAIPTLAPIVDAAQSARLGRRAMTGQLRVSGSDDKIFLEVPDNTDEAAILAVVEAHVPAPPEVLKTVDEIEASLGASQAKQRRALAELLATRPDIVKKADL